VYIATAVERMPVTDWQAVATENAALLLPSDVHHWPQEHIIQWIMLEKVSFSYFACYS